MSDISRNIDLDDYDVIVDNLDAAVTELPEKGDEVTLLYDSKYGGRVEVSGEVYEDATVTQGLIPCVQFKMNDPRENGRYFDLRLTTKSARVRTVSDDSRMRHVGRVLEITVAKDGAVNGNVP